MSNLMSDPNNGSAIKVTPELEAAIAKATSTSEIISLMHQSAIEQGLVESTGMLERDRADWFLHRPVQAASTPAAKGVARTVVIDGVKHVLEAADEAGLVKAETELYRAALAKTPTTEQTRDASGRFVSQADKDAEALRIAALDPAAVSLAPTVKAALESQGIDVEELKSFTAQKRGERFAAEWAAAGEAFRNSPAGENYPGGTENQRILGEIIVENNLVNAEDKVGAIASAYAYMCENGLVAATEEEKQAAAKKAEDAEIRQAADPEQLREILRKRGHLSSSGLWGR